MQEYGLKHEQTLGSAATYGLQTEAHLHGAQYSLLTTLFYLGYLIAQYPTSLVMQKFPIGKYLTINIVLWGGFPLSFLIY